MGLTPVGIALTLTWMSLLTANPDMSFSALETILNLDTRVTVSSIRENSIPIYRKDLPHDYVAYWQVVINDKDFVVVSSGPETGDHRLIHEGPLPTFTAQLDEHSHGQCARYSLFAPDLPIICEDNKGKVLVSTHYQLLHTKESDDSGADSGPEGLFVGPKVKKDGIPDTTLHYFVQSSLKEVGAEFEKRHKEVVKEKVWIEADGEKMASVKLAIGETIRLPVMSGAKIVAEHESSQDVVCEATGVCDGTDKTLVSKDAQSTENGITKIMFDIKSVKSVAVKLVSFRIVIKDKQENITRRYIATQTLRRSRRAATWTYFNIPHRWKFPEYNQFTYGRCKVGCGPVAWASVFAYLDRRAHSYPSSYSWTYKRLYRSGYDGTTGSNNQIAPSSSAGTRIKNYIKKMNRILGTFCMFGQGATYAGHMKRVASFYTSRVSGGKICTAYPGFLSLVAIYTSGYRNRAITYIKQGFPTIVGYKLSGNLFKQHYPIVTRYAYKRENKCVWFVCWWVIHRSFYYHMGWGGSGNGWKTAKAYMAAAAASSC